VYNEFIKQAVGKNLGDIVHVTLEKDTKKREIILPGYIEKELENTGLLDVFRAQPDYAKREQINHIEIAKKEETKVNRIATLVKRLGSYD